ncbi:STT3 domain-containing protein [Candidatus Omnitrophota bacterium]
MMIKKYAAPLIALALVLSLNIYFRAFPVHFPQLRVQARDNVERDILRSAVIQVEKNFPDYDQRAKERLIDGAINDYKTRNKTAVKREIEREHNRLKDRYQDAAGRTYLMELDCWKWARYVDNTVKLGHPGDKVVNGRQWDALMFAPNGRFLEWNHFLYYLPAFLYKGFSIFWKLPLFNFLFYLPIIFAAVFISLLFLFCYRNWGQITAIIACLFVGLAPVFLNRSTAGWFDTDIPNLLFPLLIVWTYLAAESRSGYLRRGLWFCFSAFWMGIFSFTWIYWWFIFAIIIIYELFSLANQGLLYIQNREKELSFFKQHLFSLSVFIAFTGLWVMLFSGREPFQHLFSQFFGALTLNKPLLSGIWPNVFSTVGELKRADSLRIANAVGGVYPFSLALICFALWFYRIARSKENSGFKHEATLLLTFWFLSMFFACQKGVRFAVFLLIPLGVFLGWTADDLYVRVKAAGKKVLRYLVIAVIAALCVLLVINGYEAARQSFPLMEDSWYRGLTVIKRDTPKDAVINSWWDFGDWFKVVAGRRVIFDGHQQNTPRAYWMAKVLLSRNEEEAIAILRMLNNGGNQAYELLNRQLEDPFKAVLLLEDLLLSKPDFAREKLLNLVPAEVAQQVLSVLFVEPGNAYFVVDPTMQRKIPAISYLGEWDFHKVFIAQGRDRLTEKQIVDRLAEFGMDQQESRKLYSESSLLSSGARLEDWVSNRLRFYSRLTLGDERGGLVYFDNGLVYNLKEQTVYIYSERQRRYLSPKRLFIFDEGILKEKAFSDGELDYSVMVLKRPAGYAAVLLDEELAKSLYVRLFFFNGEGLKHFKLFTQEPGAFKVFKIDWN